MSKTDHGTVEVKVGDDAYVLNFNLKAVKNIESRFGGLSPALAEVQKLSLGVAASIIAAGASLTLKPKEFAALEGAIYEAGIGEVTPPLIQYLLALLNPSAKSEEELEAAAEESNSAGKK